MPITSVKIHPPASLRSDSDRHHVETVIGIKSESVITFVGIPILAHRPGWNAQKNIDRKSEELSRLHVFNWGCHRSLLPEVSGLRYTSVFDDEKDYKQFAEP
jgi:hypothetical protein